jgi:hypothetical protein
MICNRHGKGDNCSPFNELHRLRVLDILIRFELSIWDY